MDTQSPFDRKPVPRDTILPLPTLPAFAPLARSSRFARNRYISKRRVYHRRDEYEILTGETEREGGGGRFGTRRKRGRKGWAQPPPRWLPPRPTSLLSRQVYDEPTQTRHLAANWPPSYRSLAFFLPPIPSPVWNPTAHSLVLPTHSVHRCASERDLSATIRNKSATFSPCIQPFIYPILSRNCSFRSARDEKNGLKGVPLLSVISAIFIEIGRRSSSSGESGCTIAEQGANDVFSSEES